MISLLKRVAFEMLAKSGRRVTRYPIAQYLRDFRIDCVLDVGANTGQYAKEIRSLGYLGRIESFEPIPAAIKPLQIAAEKDGKWNVHPFALGNEPCTRGINVSANLPSSSFLELDGAFDTADVDLSTRSVVEVKIERLDDVFEKIVASAKNIYMKIDTQGFERSVIEGGLSSLKRISIVQMELAVVPNYQGESLIEDMIAMMRKLDFTPWWLMDGYRNPTTQQMYQMDVFFVRSDAQVSN